MEHPSGFGTALNCMDGRTHRAVLDWFARELGIEHVDLITEPGIVRILADGDDSDVARLVEKVRISRDAHGSRVVAIVAHDDCAGNPVSAAEQKRQLAEATRRLSALVPGMAVRGLWIARGFDTVEAVE